MKKITIIKSMAAPLLIDNIDTDIISPMAGLTNGDSDNPFSSVEKYAFAAIRYMDGDVEKALLNPDFSLNDPLYSKAQILITGENFGCGSSRETAPAGIYALGIRCIIGSTFGDIFFNNCFQQGILPVQLDHDIIVALAEQCGEGEFVVDLPDQKLTLPSDTVINFEVNEFRKQSLLKGMDDISMTLIRVAEIKNFQQNDRLKRPWIYL